MRILALIASSYVLKWYALPSNLAGSSKAALSRASVDVKAFERAESWA
jgi:hypothetical protein